MKNIILILSILILFNSSLAFSAMQIKLESIAQKFILAESADVIKITWKNDGEKDLIIPYRIMPFNDNEQLIKWNVIGPIRIECKQRREPEVKWAALAHDILKAGAEKSFTISLGQLGIVAIGEYEIWIEYDSTNLYSYWDEVHITRIKVTSNHIKIELNNPIGIDAEVFNKYKAKCNILGISGLEILKSYPSSTYAAWVLFGWNLGEVDRIEPEKLKQLIEKNLFPIQNGSYDPDSGNWKEMRGKDLAQWQIKWSESILMNHSDFAYAKSLKLLIAVDSIVIGEKEKGINLLREMSKEKDTKEGQWAQKFLSIMNY